MLLTYNITHEGETPLYCQSTACGPWLSGSSPLPHTVPVHPATESLVAHAVDFVVPARWLAQSICRQLYLATYPALLYLALQMVCLLSLSVSLTIIRSILS